MTPSLRAIFRRPSNVELKVRRWTSSTAHSAGGGGAEVIPSILGAARQNSALPPEKKTSRQHDVIPSSAVWAGEREEVVMASLEKSTTGWGAFCDWRRTRTTSRGVTERDKLVFGVH